MAAEPLRRVSLEDTWSSPAAGVPSPPLGNDAREVRRRRRAGVRLLGEEERAAGLEQRLRRSKAEANFAGAIGSVCMSTIVAAGTALALWPSHGSSC